MVSFTGGLATGQAIIRASAETVKRVAVELGGKNPNIVFADAVDGGVRDRRRQRPHRRLPALRAGVLGRARG